ncbi:hypothetical protein JW988_01485 [Candidatus Bathyarchaeota archaeon]|nr:hypothetical protein [Candidatus Bathyarchaeota archaeon]
MSGKKLQEEISLGTYTAQLLNYGNIARAFPFETIEIGIVKVSEVSE